MIMLIALSSINETPELVLWHLFVESLYVICININGAIFSTPFFHAKPLQKQPKFLEFGLKIPIWQPCTQQTDLE